MKRTYWVSLNGSHDKSLRSQLEELASKNLARRIADSRWGRLYELQEKNGKLPIIQKD